MSGCFRNQCPDVTGIRRNKVSEDGKIKFAFIKATEGTSFKDVTFGENWNGTKENGILRGAYHYFSIGVSGIKQAENFVETVPLEKESLPPVIDLEEKHLNKEIVLKNLNDYIEIIEKAYKCKPILYVTYATYNKYIKEYKGRYVIWIRDVFWIPSDGEDSIWTIWQFSERGKINGIKGNVDLNLYKYKDMNYFFR